MAVDYTLWTRRSDERAARDRREGRRLLWAFASILALAVALDGLAQSRISALSSATLARSLEPLNADVGGWFLKVGQEEFRLGRPGYAREGFAAALRYPQHSEAAAQGLRELDAPPRWRSAPDAAGHPPPSSWRG